MFFCAKINNYLANVKLNDGLKTSHIMRTLETTGIDKETARLVAQDIVSNQSLKDFVPKNS